MIGEIGARGTLGKTMRAKGRKRVDIGLILGSYRGETRQAFCNGCAKSISWATWQARDFNPGASLNFSAHVCEVKRGMSENTLEKMFT